MNRLKAGPFCKIKYQSGHYTKDNLRHHKANPSQNCLRFSFQLSTLSLSLSLHSKEDESQSTNGYDLALSSFTRTQKASSHLIWARL